MVLTGSSVSYKSISQVITSVQEGNLTTTTLALICLNDVITSDSAQCIQAIIDKKAIKLLLNILEANFICVRRSQFAALRCLTKLCDSKVLQKEILNLNGIQLLFRCLNVFDFELKFTTIHLISIISSDPSSWDSAYECGGIPQLIALLDTSQRKMTFASQMSKADITQLKLSVAQFSAKSLSLLCQYEANRKIACLSNIIPICHCWVKSKHQKVIIPILLLLQQLSMLTSFRKQVNESPMIVDVLNHLRSADMEVKQVAADLILICADDQETFRYFHKEEFVTEIFHMVSNKSYHENEHLMTSVTGILWKCSKTDLATRQLEKLGAIPIFTQLLESPSLQVKAYVVGTIGMCFKSTILRETIKKNDIIETMVQYLQTTHIPLIINLNEALSKGSCDPEILNLYIQLDTVQLIWSCLKNSDVQVKSSAVWSLCTILKNMKKANLHIQNSLDGIECIIDILTSKNKKLLMPACSLIHNLAKDKNAVSVLVEFNVASHLRRHMKTKDKKLLQHLCLAVASCCSSKKSCEKFKGCGITHPLIKNLRTENRALRVTAAAALSKIASLSNWSPDEHRSKIIPVLTDLLTDLRNKEGNESAAVILRHILCIYEKECIALKDS